MGYLSQRVLGMVVAVAMGYLSQRVLGMVVAVVMGYLSHRVRLDQIKPGDHIYTWRPAFSYAHHGIYVGKKKVIHFTVPGTDSSVSGWKLSSSIPSSCLNSIVSRLSLPKSGQNCDSGLPRSNNKLCGFQQSDSGVFVSCLSCFIGTGSLYFYQYGVNRFSIKLRGGTCTSAPSDPPQNVIALAEYFLKNGFGEYNLVNNNCEDFALCCKTKAIYKKRATGRGSGQVNFIATVFLYAISLFLVKIGVAYVFTSPFQALLKSGNLLGMLVCLSVCLFVTYCLDRD